MNDITAASPNATIIGSNTGDLFGWSVSDAGEVNGEYPDIIIGAPGYNDKGRAYIFSGRSTALWSSVDDADSDVEIIFDGEYVGDKFGSSVSTPGDMNKNNFDANWAYRKLITIN